MKYILPILLSILVLTQTTHLSSGPYTSCYDYPYTLDNENCEHPILFLLVTTAICCGGGFLLSLTTDEKKKTNKVISSMLIGMGAIPLGLILMVHAAEAIDTAIKKCAAPNTTFNQYPTVGHLEWLKGEGYYVAAICLMIGALKFGKHLGTKVKNKLFNKTHKDDINAETTI
ncbi:hypothetical protein HOM50_00745 [bacterium]|jgi:hypothetical protein|nr:hypothetical protein [bacterium]MBT5014919.1 hypothetical protein [bacterium]